MYQPGNVIAIVIVLLSSGDCAFSLLAHLPTMLPHAFVAFPLHCQNKSAPRAVAILLWLVETRQKHLPPGHTQI